MRNWQAANEQHDSELFLCLIELLHLKLIQINTEYGSQSFDAPKVEIETLYLEQNTNGPGMLVAKAMYNYFMPLVRIQTHTVFICK